MTGPRTPVYERFMSYVDISSGPDGCHPWTGCLHRGYGKFSVGSNKITAMRWLLGHLRGEPLAPQEYACHTCDNPPCVNPRHLYVGSAAQNMADMNARRRNSLVIARREATHCKHGHEFTLANTYTWRGSRHCKACKRLRDAKRDRSRAVAS